MTGWSRLEIVLTVIGLIVWVVIASWAHLGPGIAVLGALALLALRARAHGDTLL